MPVNHDVSASLVGFFKEIGGEDLEAAVRLAAGFDAACVMFLHHPEWFTWVATQRTDGVSEEWTGMLTELIPAPRDSNGS